MIALPLAMTIALTSAASEARPDGAFPGRLDVASHVALRPASKGAAGFEINAGVYVSARQPPAGSGTQVGPDLTDDERRVLPPLIAAEAASNWQAVEEALPQARAVVTSQYARYLLNRVLLSLATSKNDAVGVFRAINALLSNWSTPDDVSIELQAVKGRWIQQNILPVTNEINALERSGAPVSEELYDQAISLIFVVGAPTEFLDMSSRKLKAHNSERNWALFWRDYWDLRPDAPRQLDVYRLARETGGLNKPERYIAYAESLARDGLWGEVQSVLNEGIGRGMSANDPAVQELLAKAGTGIVRDQATLNAAIADARRASDGNGAYAIASGLYGYSRFAESAEMFRQAITQRGVNPSYARLGVGLALFKAGRVAEARAELSAIPPDSGLTSDLRGGPAELARLWIIAFARE